MHRLKLTVEHRESPTKVLITSQTPYSQMGSPVKLSSNCFKLCACMCVNVGVYTHVQVTSEARDITSPGAGVIG